jgi:hypothetical protein
VWAVCLAASFVPDIAQSIGEHQRDKLKESVFLSRSEPANSKVIQVQRLSDVKGALANHDICVCQGDPGFFPDHVKNLFQNNFASRVFFFTKVDAIMLELIKEGDRTGWWEVFSIPKEDATCCFVSRDSTPSATISKLNKMFPPISDEAEPNLPIRDNVKKNNRA